MNNKRIFIIHGWEGNPREGWQNWLAGELEKKGFKVICPAMPDTENPKIETWVPTLSKEVGEADKNTFFVGHSIGCQTILRYLESLEEDKIVGGALFVAGFLTLQNLETEEEKKVALPWLEAPIDFEKVKKIINKSIAIFSDNDHYVPLSNKDLFKEKIGSEIIMEEGRGHFTGEDGLYEFPNALESILKIVK